jgi:hypothetical protein
MLLKSNEATHTQIESPLIDYHLDGLKKEKLLMRVLDLGSN